MIFVPNFLSFLKLKTKASIVNHCYKHSNMVFTAQCLMAVKKSLAQCNFESLDTLSTAMRESAAQLGLSMKQLMLITRLAITGTKVLLHPPNSEVTCDTNLGYPWIGSCNGTNWKRGGSEETRGCTSHCSIMTTTTTTNLY